MTLVWLLLFAVGVGQIVQFTCCLQCGDSAAAVFSAALVLCADNRTLECVEDKLASAPPRTPECSSSSSSSSEPPLSAPPSCDTISPTALLPPPPHPTCLHPSSFEPSHAHGRLQHGVAAEFSWLRMVVLCCVLVFVITLVTAVSHVDSVPAFVRKAIIRSFACQHGIGKDAEIPLSKILGYQIDRWLSRYPGSKLVVLGGTTVALIFFGCLALFAAGEGSLYTAFWSAVAGAGLDWKSSEADTLFVRWVSLLLAIGGMLVTAMLMSLVSDYIHSRVDDLKKGKTDVLESGHIVIVGWSLKIFTLLNELCAGKEATGGATIVVISDMKKEMMELEIKLHSIDTRNSTIVCRTGNPLIGSQLKKVSMKYASATIVLAELSNGEDSDARLLRIVLNILNTHQTLMEAKGTGIKGHVVGEVCSQDNAVLVNQITQFYPGATKIVHLMSTGDILSRMMLQSVRCPHIGPIMSSLVGFDGSEFYTVDGPIIDALAGLKFRQLQYVFPLAVPMGVVLPKYSKIRLNPNPNYVMKKGDGLVLLAEDETQLYPLYYDVQELLNNTAVQAAEEALKLGTVIAMTPENVSPAGCRLPAPRNSLKAANRWKTSLRTIGVHVLAAVKFARQSFGGKLLIVGWRQDMVSYIHVLDSFLSHASELWLFSDIPLDDRWGLLAEGGLALDPEGRSPALRHLRVRYLDANLMGSALSRSKLELLNPLQFASILILANDSGGFTDGNAWASSCDANSLMTVFILRSIQIMQMGKQAAAQAACNPTTLTPDSKCATGLHAPCAVEISCAPPLTQAAASAFARVEVQSTLSTQSVEGEFSAACVHSHPHFSAMWACSQAPTKAAAVEWDRNESARDARWDRNPLYLPSMELTPSGARPLLLHPSQVTPIDLSAIQLARGSAGNSVRVHAPAAAGVYGSSNTIGHGHGHAAVYVPGSANSTLHGDAASAGVRLHAPTAAGVPASSSTTAPGDTGSAGVLVYVPVAVDVHGTGPLPSLPSQFTPIDLAAIQLARGAADNRVQVHAPAAVGVSGPSSRPAHRDQQKGSEKEKGSEKVSPARDLDSSIMDSEAGSFYDEEDSADDADEFGDRVINQSPEEWKKALKRTGLRSVIVTQLIDPRTSALMTDVAGTVNRYIITTQTISQLLALISLAPNRLQIFQEFFAPTGNDIIVRPPSRFMQLGDKAVSFQQLAVRGLSEGEILLGYILPNLEVKLNPPLKDAEIFIYPRVGQPLMEGHITVKGFVVVAPPRQTDDCSVAS